MSKLGIEIIQGQTHYIIETMKTDIFTKNELEYLLKIFNELSNIVRKTLEKGPNV